MTRRGALLLAVAVATGTAAQAAPGIRVEVWQDPNCGCCGGWVRHMRGAGFEVVAHDTAELDAVKRANGVPEALWSCHTALVEGYVVEGHVPVGALARLLAERPDIRGISLPGMPLGSPGMNGPKTEPFIIYTLPRDPAAEPAVYAVE
ncbi:MULTISPECIES: DUF411 domain-containing protein [Roseomonadaceae]|uniref:DUF411 domain-containing protein n=1 Tax=Caldovatus aquaticus TaxID=2865671 RepID=A0ABS7F5H1_9PROT|nr:DUF411 domain-containing protein [Crenalkalicoccus roseus]MBW8270809.1 DUF411 domain-containing protein [Caldovatus aquaticus]